MKRSNRSVPHLKVVGHGLRALLNIAAHTDFRCTSLITASNVATVFETLWQPEPDLQFLTPPPRLHSRQIVRQASTAQPPNGLPLLVAHSYALYAQPDLVPTLTELLQANYSKSASHGLLWDATGAIDALCSREHPPFPLLSC